MSKKQESQMLRQLLRSLNRGERGSAMTEFVIGLPIYVLIFIGMGMLYSYNHEGLIARMNTISALSAATMAINNFEDFTPGAGGTISIAGLGDVNFPGSGSGSIYTDSGAKATLGDRFGELERAPVSNVEGATQYGASVFAGPLLDDRSKVDTEGASDISGLISGIISLLGVNVSIGAGIRYTPIVADAGAHTFTHPWGGTTTYNPGPLDLPAPTAATHRAFPIALARLQMDQYEPYASTMLEFNTSGGSNDMPGGGAGSSSGGGLSEAQGDECAAEGQAYADCVNSPEAEEYAATQNCGLVGWRSCYVTEYPPCEALEPAGECRQAGQEAAQQIENAFCNDPSFNCARGSAPSGHENYSYSGSPATF